MCDTIFSGKPFVLCAKATIHPVMLKTRPLFSTPFLSAAADFTRPLIPPTQFETIHKRAISSDERLITVPR